MYIYFCEYYTEILRQLGLKRENKINGKVHHFFFLLKNYWVIKYLALWSPELQNTDQKNSEYEHFSRSVAISNFTKQILEITSFSMIRGRILRC